MRDIWDEPIEEAVGFSVDIEKFKSAYSLHVKSYKSSNDSKYFIGAFDLCRAAIALHACCGEDGLINKVISDFCSDLSPYEYMENFTDSMLYCINENDIREVLLSVDEIKQVDIRHGQYKHQKTTSNIWGNLSAEFLFNHNVEELRKNFKD